MIHIDQPNVQPSDGFAGLQHPSTNFEVPAGFYDNDTDILANASFAQDRQLQVTPKPVEVVKTEDKVAPKSSRFLGNMDKTTWAKLNFVMNLAVLACTVAAGVLHAYSGNTAAVAAVSGAAIMNGFLGYANLQRMFGADI